MNPQQGPGGFALAHPGGTPMQAQAGLAPWLRQAQGPITPTPAAPQGQAPWYADLQKQDQARAIPPEILKQMLMAEQLRKAKEAEQRRIDAQPKPRGETGFERAGMIDVGADILYGPR